MFLRCKVRRKDGKQHRYWSVVENTRVAGGRVVQRHVLYLGEINDHAAIGVAAVDRGFGGWRRATPDAVAVSGGSLRRTAGGRLDRPRHAVGIAAAPAAAVGRVLAGSAAVARAAAGPVLVEAAGVEPQGDALGSGPVRAGRLPSAGAGQRMAAAPRVVSTQRSGRPPG